MRIPIIAGNWKMYKTIGEATALLAELKLLVANVTGVEIVVCPPFTALKNAGHALTGSSIKLGAQNIFWETEGAYTGEISPLMLKDAGCSYVIIGHSERRGYFKEENEAVNKKLRAAISAGLTPIMCVGERLEEREAGKTFAVIEDHLKGGLCGIDKETTQDIVIAYEPVWAIGTGKTATPRQVEEAHSFIRKTLAALYDEETANNIRIQYGGSVKPENIKELMREKDIDGALVGGASLKADSFADIVMYKEKG